MLGLGGGRGVRIWGVERLGFMLKILELAGRRTVSVRM